MRLAVIGAGLVLVAAAGGAGVLAYQQERDARRADVRRLETDLDALRGDLAAARKTNAQLSKSLRSVSSRVRKARV